MQRIGRRAPLAALVIFLFPAPARLAGQDASWLLFERARYAFEQREFGEALRMFRAVKEANPDMPEVDMAIGEVFAAEGEYAIALLQYERAYERRRLLIVPDDAVEILYRMANIHKLLGEYLQYESLLRTIIERVDAGYDQPPSRIEAPMYRILLEDGLDKVLLLYRFDDRGAQYAQALLSRFLLYRSHRFAEASRAAAYSIVMTLSEIIAFVRTIDPEYRYTGVEQLMYDTRRFPEVRDYLVRSDLYEQLFILGHSLDASGKVAPAESIRRLLMRIDPTGAAGIRASRGFAPLP